VSAEAGPEVSAEADLHARIDALQEQLADERQRVVKAEDRLAALERDIKGLLMSLAECIGEMGQAQRDLLSAARMLVGTESAATDPAAPKELADPS
jgi:chromosome segregation ATPase